MPVSGQIIVSFDENDHRVTLCVRIGIVTAGLPCDHVIHFDGKDDKTMIIKETLYYDPAGEDRTVHIYLPDNYNETDERYPVMYFFDGHNLFLDSDATYGKSWGLKEFLDGWQKPMIVVGLECSHQGNHRLDEYCPYDANLMSNNIHGEGRETMDWIVGTLKPYIDKNYRTYSFREATAIGGSSMGGLMSLFAVTAYNSTFSKAACVSSTLFIVRDRLFDEIEHCRINPDTRVYFSWGEKESGQNTDFARLLSQVNYDAQDLLNSKGALTQVFFQVDGGHCEADWEKQVPGFMQFLWM